VPALPSSLFFPLQIYTKNDFKYLNKEPKYNSQSTNKDQEVCNKHKLRAAIGLGILGSFVCIVVRHVDPSMPSILRYELVIAGVFVRAFCTALFRIPLWGSVYGKTEWTAFH
jgi:hypothetical protein